jgi:diguanylate cyclase (GGDEF)-like protein
MGHKKLAVSTTHPQTRTYGRILALLENLKSTSAGSALYRHIENSFVELEASQQQSEKLYLNLLESLLENLAVHFPAGTEQWMQIRIMQKTLQDSMTSSELHKLQLDIQQLISQARKDGSLGQKSMQETIDALLNDLHGTPREADTAQLQNEAAATPHTDQFDLEQPAAHQSGSAISPDAPYCNLDKTRHNIHHIQASLSHQINNAKEFNSALAKLLHSSFAAIRNLDQSADLGLIKNNFLKRYARLIKMQQDLATKFETIDEGLNDIESSSQNLDEELSRVHRLSLTDDLTQLPNRRAFLMRLDDEVSRALRFDYPLTMALVDIDNFKPINDTFGHAAGDVILRHFAQNMNVVFRYHDMASRYGGEEFAVLFPNTDTHGAMSALSKLQYKLKADPYILYKNDEIPVPTFSAGVALYNPGEDADELIKRADVAMYKAKSSGRDLLKVDPLGIAPESSSRDNNSDSGAEHADASA